MFRLSPHVVVALVLIGLSIGPATATRAQPAQKKKGASRPPVSSERPRQPPAGKAAAGKASAGDDVQPASGEQPRLPRPKAEPLRIEKLSPELEQLLANWESQSAGFTNMSGIFKRYKYDETWAIEYHADGKFAYRAPDKGAYELKGSNVEKVKPKKTTDDGEPFEVRSDRPEHWVCTGSEIYKFDDQEKTYEKAPLPPDLQGESIIEGPLPFLFGMKAERAKQRYAFKLLPPKPKPPGVVWLKVRPREGQDAANWSEAEIGLYEDSFLPYAVLLTDPAGTIKTVHVFTKIEVNKGGNLIQKLFERDPFKLDLSRHKLVMNDKSPAEADLNPRSPGGRTGPSGKGAAKDQDAGERQPGRAAENSTGPARPGARKSPTGTRK